MSENKSNKNGVIVSSRSFREAQQDEKGLILKHLGLVLSISSISKYPHELCDASRQEHLIAVAKLSFPDVSHIFDYRFEKAGGPLQVSHCTWYLLLGNAYGPADPPKK